MEDVKITFDNLQKIVEDQRILIHQLKQENQKLDDFGFLFEESADFIGIMNSEGEMKRINSSFSKIIGLSYNNPKDVRFSDYIHPDDLDSAFTVLYSFSLGLTSVGFECRILSSNGKYITVQWFAKINPSNKYIYVIGRDITKVKATQQKLMARKRMLNEALSLAKLGSWNYNVSDKSIFWSDEFSRIINLNVSQKDHLYQYYRDHFLDNDFLQILGLNSTSKNVLPFDCEYTIRLSESVSKTIMVTAMPVFNRKEELVSMRGYIQDVTQRRLVEDAIKSQRYAEAASKAKSDFVAHMSHEIRTPLNGIIGITNLLADCGLNEEQALLLDKVSRSATTLLDIINETLDLSKIEAGKLNLHEDRVNLANLIPQIVDVFSHQAKHNNISLLYEFDNDIPNELLLDSLRLRQILANLLGNALKFTNRGSVKLKVESLPSENACVSKIRFMVQDTGMGIKEENLKRIFGSYEQEDDTVCGRFGGTGLGLSISKKLLKLMNSKLEVKSVYGEGSEFSFVTEFIVLNDECESIDLLNLSENKRIEFMVDLNDLQIKILLVEDNDINIFLAKKLLGKILPKSIVHEAKNGEEAVKMNSSQDFDMILMDVIMPVMDGYQATSEIRSNPKYQDLPIIALTAGIMHGEKEQCLEIGMNDFLSKPIIEDQLKSIIHKWVKTE